MFVLAMGNLQQTDRQSDELKTITAIATRGDICCWNEARDAGPAIQALLGFDSVLAGGVGVSWRTDKFLKVDSGSRLVMLGGRRGTGAAGDQRRRGPNRWVVWVVLEERSTGHEVLVFSHHSIAKADTSAKWRRPLRALGWANVGAEINRALRRNPSVDGYIGTGDLNSIQGVNYPFLNERRVPTPATFGRNHYDQIHAEGVKVTGVTAFATHSDHKGLQATVELGVGTVIPPSAPPVVVPPKPTVRRRRRNPWRRFSRRWRRRHPIRWRRIIRRWRRNRRRNP